MSINPDSSVKVAKQNALQWFRDNSCFVHTHSLQYDSKTDEIISDIIQAWDGVGPLNISSNLTIYKPGLTCCEKLKSLPPFKFGSIGTLFLSDIDSFLKMDMSSVYMDMPHSFNLKVNDYAVDMHPILEHIIGIKGIAGATISLEAPYAKIKVKGLIDSVNLITRSQRDVAFKINVTDVVLGIDVLSREDMSLSVIRTIRFDHKSTRDGQRLEITNLDNALDLQEWLFDNGYENLL